METTFVGGSSGGSAATLGVGSTTAAASAVTVGVGSTAADVVTGSTALARLVVVPISFRAAAIAIHGSGDSAGAVGEVPANGLSNALTAREMVLATESAGAGG